MLNMNSHVNVVNSLINRERGVKCNLRHNLKLMSRLVTSETSRFVKIWEKHSSKPIHHEGGRLYFDQYSSCYAISGYQGIPCSIYQLSNCTGSEKIEEAVICRCPIDLTSLPRKHKDHRPSFLALTANNWLIRYDFDTGQLLQKVYLSHRQKFRHISWDCEDYSVVLRSTHNKMSTIARQAAITQVLMMSIAVLTVFPFQFVALLDVTKKIFGHDIRDAMITQGVLIVMHQGDLVKLYSFDHILQMGRAHSPQLYDTIGTEHETVGSFPTGLPVNIKLEECPPCLFQVKCADHSLSLGGIPWHYIITPPGAKGFFKMYSLQDEQLADGGYLELDTVSIEPDKCVFHPDDSGRIMHLGSREIHVHQLIEKDDVLTGLPRHRLKEVYMIQPFSDEEKKPEVPYCSSSGRIIKKSTAYYDEVVHDLHEDIPTVDYEDEFDLLYLSVVRLGQDGPESKIQIYDNQSGKLMKEFPLEEEWKEFSDHIISLDLDTLVHIVKSPMRKFSCYVYRLQRADQDCAPNQVNHAKARSRHRQAIGESLLQDTVRRSSLRNRRLQEEEEWS